MSNTANLLDRARTRLGLTSDNKLAQALSWPQGTIAGYRTGRRCMDLEQAAEFTAKTGIALEEIAAAAIADRKRIREGGKGQKSLNLAAA